MEKFILINEATVRTSCFLGIFLIIALWEHSAPKRELTTSKLLRWSGNLGIVLTYTVLLQVMFPVLTAQVATLAEERGWGLFNNIDMPHIIKLVLTVVIMDLLIYIQHVTFHYLPLLWRIHRMHHSDVDYDVTTGARFHPVEIILSTLIKMLAVISIGASALSVIIFEVLLNAMAMFNHGNIAIPFKLDKVLRLFIVTPDMHRVHHSVRPRETNSNFGFNLSYWDRLFGTYIAQPEDGHDRMTIGLSIFRDSKYIKLHWMLLQPFLSKTEK